MDRVMTSLHKERVNREDTMVNQVHLCGCVDGADVDREVELLIPLARAIWEDLHTYEDVAGLLNAVGEVADKYKKSLYYRLFLGLALSETAPDDIGEDFNILIFLGIDWERLPAPEGVAKFRPVLRPTRQG